MHKISLLGAGFIGMFYTLTINRSRSKDMVSVVYNRTPETAEEFSRQYNIPRWTGDIDEAIHDQETDVVVIGLPNFEHMEAAIMAAEAGDLENEDAVYELLCLDRTVLEIDNFCSKKVKEIKTSLMNLLMEGLKIKDEREHESKAKKTPLRPLKSLSK